MKVDDIFVSFKKISLKIPSISINTSDSSIQNLKYWSLVWEDQSNKETYTCSISYREDDVVLSFMINSSKQELSIILEHRSSIFIREETMPIIQIEVITRWNLRSIRGISFFFAFFALWFFWRHLLWSTRRLLDKEGVDEGGWRKIDERWILLPLLKEGWRKINGGIKKIKRKFLCKTKNYSSFIRKWHFAKECRVFFL